MLNEDLPQPKSHPEDALDRFMKLNGRACERVNELITVVETEKSFKQWGIIGQVRHVMQALAFDVSYRTGVVQHEWGKLSELLVTDGGMKREKLPELFDELRGMAKQFREERNQLKAEERAARRLTGEREHQGTVKRKPKGRDKGDK